MGNSSRELLPQYALRHIGRSSNFSDVPCDIGLDDIASATLNDDTTDARSASC